MTPTETVNAPHPYTVYSDFAKAVMSIGVTSLAVLVTFSGPLIDSPGKKWIILSLVGLTLLLLLLSVACTMILTSKLTRVLRNDPKAGPTADADIKRLANEAYGGLFAAAVLFLVAGVVRAVLAKPPMISAEIVIAKVAGMTFPTSCGSAVNKELVLLQLNSAKTEWRRRSLHPVQAPQTLAPPNFLSFLRQQAGRSQRWSVADR